MTASSRSELEAERSALAGIVDAHLRYLEHTRRIAEGLAAEAAEAIEDGIRDIIDEDAEADAAIRAVLVRQSSQRAMHAARRVADLESQGDALAFGHITNSDGDRLYIGRRTVLDGDEPLLVDWRARASVPFYRATPIEPLGQVHRRHFHYDDPSPATESTLIDYSDELFDLGRSSDLLPAAENLRGEAALLSALSGPTGGRLTSVVATIQAEQDAIIRARTDRPLVVQGGPGTGKTVVALHRAAYLLYDQRVDLADTGVLVVGPSRRFLNYIAGVLPSLGESGVVSVTVDGLYRGAAVSSDDDDEVAALKGSAAMVELLEHAVRARQRQPVEPLKVWYGSSSVVLGVDELERIFGRAQRNRHHNDGAAAFRTLLIDRLALAVFDPAFHNLEEARESFGSSAEIRAFCLDRYPPLTPEQALNDLLGSPALLRFAAAKAGLTDAEARLLGRERTPERELAETDWSGPDMALLDELLNLLGPLVTGDVAEQLVRRDELDEFDLAREVDEVIEDQPVERDDRDDDVEFSLGGGFDTEGPGDGYFAVESAFQAVAAELAEESLYDDEEPADDDDEIRGVVESDGRPIGELDIDSVDMAEEEGATVAELAIAERSWRFGHVIVDEAQDLTAMQWRMVARRTIDRAVTIVGDLAQRSTGEVVEDWSQLLPPSLVVHDFKQLTVNYRSPSELDPMANRLMASLVPALRPARSLRSAGSQPTGYRIDGDDSLIRLIADEAATIGTGRVLAVIGSFDDARREHLDMLVNGTVNADDDVAPNIVVLDAAESKGLEFDSVVVVEPDEVAARPGGLSLLYIAITRTTDRLTVAYTRAGPVVRTYMPTMPGR